METPSFPGYTTIDGQRIFFLSSEAFANAAVDPSLIEARQYESARIMVITFSLCTLGRTPNYSLKFSRDMFGPIVALVVFILKRKMIISDIL